MKSKGAFVPHSNHGVAKKSFFTSNHKSSSNSIDCVESEHHQLYHHHPHQGHDRPASNLGEGWFEPLFKGFIPFSHKKQHSQQRVVHQPVFIFIAWCLVLAIASTSLIDCVYAGADDVASKSAFGSASLPVYNLGPEITTEFGEC